MKRRLACLLRRWAYRLDPPAEPTTADFYASTGMATARQTFATPAGWTWNTATGGTTAPVPPLPQPPPLRVVR